jgi:type II secretory pathway pseudopilin PulG
MRNFRRESGFTFMEILIALSLLTVAFVSIVPLYFQVAKYVASNRDKSESNTVVAREMEKIRNATYEDVGIAGGNPSGIFVADKDETQPDGAIYHIATRIWWVDDPMDGTAALGTDPMPNDYKTARITVTLKGTTVVLAQLTSNIARSSEEAPISGGNIIVKVVLADGTTPLTDVKVNITTGPSSPLQGWTGDNGTTLFAEITPSIIAGDYALSVSKDGYVVRSDQNVLTTTVVFGQTRTVTFIMDTPGHFTVRLKDPSGTVISKVSQIVVSNSIAGDKTYDANTGYFDFPLTMPGDYQVTASAASYLPCTIAKTATVTRNGTTILDITLQPIVFGHLALTTKDNVTGLVLGNCAVKLTSQDTGAILNTTTNGSGTVTVDLDPGTYTVDVTAAYHQPFTTMATITSGATTTLVASLLGYPQYGSIRVRAQKSSNSKARSGVSIEVTGTGYTATGVTDSNGEVTFSTLLTGPYVVYRWGSYQWIDPRNTTVTAGNESYIVFSY